MLDSFEIEALERRFAERHAHVRPHAGEADTNCRTRIRVGRHAQFCETPKHGSWLNIAENELSSLTRQCLADRRIGDIATLQEEIAAWSCDVYTTQRGVDWQMIIDDARCKLKSVYPKIKD